ncbi:hypothetical protein [Brevibacillus sp. H7]|uniref:hypothetical protein n=1 Tax=Brevibacillus sp. H7 TaxID=3349138 RepID=UPI0038034064
MFKQTAASLLTGLLLLTGCIDTSAAHAPVTLLQSKNVLASLQAMEVWKGKTYSLKNGKVYARTSTIPLSIPAKVTRMAGGDEFMVFQTEDKRVFFMGVLYDSYFAYAGRKPKFSSMKPTAFPLKGIEKMFVGRNELFMITTNKDLYVMGANDLGQLGLSDTRFAARPTKVLGGVREAATNSNDSVVVAEDGIYVTGSNVNFDEPVRGVFRKVGPSEKDQRVFTVDYSFYLPTATGGSIIGWGGPANLRPLTDPAYHNAVAFKHTPYTDFLIKANGEVWVRYGYKAVGQYGNDTKVWPWEGLLYSGYELLGTGAHDASIAGTTMYLFGGKGATAKPYPSRQALIDKVKQNNKHMKSLVFDAKRGIFTFHELQ